MTEYGPVGASHSFDLHSLLQLIRIFGAILGIVIIVIGLSYVMRMFGMITTALHNPETYQILLEKWISAVGQEDLSITLAGTTYDFARIFAFMILGGGGITLSWLALGIISVGAKILSSTIGDREAIRRILTQAVGSKKRT